MSATARVAILLCVSCMIGGACAKASGEQPDGPLGAGDAATIVDAPDVDDAASEPDANTCATQPCDILSQCGCGADACDIDNTDNMGTACRTVFTPGRETATCSNPTRCDAGYVCLVGGNIGSCKKYCDADADCGTPRGKCVIEITSGGVPLAGIPITCSSNCDPTNVVASGLCPATMKCGLFTTTFNGVTHNIADCAPATASGTQGVNCKVGAAADDKLCAQDFLCTSVDSGTTNNCRRICNKTLNTGCGALTCIGFATPNIVGGTEYGVCN